MSEKHGGGQGQQSFRLCKDPMVHFTVDQNRLSDKCPASMLVKSSFSNMAEGELYRPTGGLSIP